MEPKEGANPQGGWLCAVPEGRGSQTLRFLVLAAMCAQHGQGNHPQGGVCLCACVCLPGGNQVDFTENREMWSL